VVRFSQPANPGKGDRMNNAEPDVLNNANARRFEFHSGKLMARLDYRLQNRTIVILHTEVPSELAGCGVGAKLVKAALEYARESGFTVVPLCSYAAAYIQRNPQYQALVEPSGDPR
jgi:predicted GNAT family acetyltransferase